MRMISLEDIGHEKFARFKIRLQDMRIISYEDIVRHADIGHAIQKFGRGNENYMFARY